MAEMPKFVADWPVVGLLGEGGQRKVYLVRHPARERELKVARADVGEALRTGGAIGQTADQQQDRIERMIAGIRSYSREDLPDELGAAKVYEIPGGAGRDKAIGRLQKELEALEHSKSPHILKLLHKDVASTLMITEYCPGGSLNAALDRFKGRPLKALQALRGVVQAVAELHLAGIVHRDIKTANILIAQDGRLVLGAGCQ
jgi:serine/threonine protein kinase